MIKIVKEKLNQKKVTYKKLAYLLKNHFKNSKKLILFLCMLEVFATVRTYVSLYLSKELLNLITDVIVNQKSLQYTFLNLLFWIALILVSTVAFGFLDNLQTLLNKKLTESIDKYNKILILKKINALDISVFDIPKFYDESQRAQSDSSSINGILSQFFSFIRTTTGLVTAVVIAFSFDIWISLFAVCLAVPHYFISKKVNKRAYENEKELIPVNRRVEYFNSILNSKWMSKEIRLYNVFPFFLNHYKVTRQNAFDANIRTTKKNMRSNLFIKFYGILINAICQLLVILKVIINKMTVGDYTFYLGTIQNLSSSFIQLLELFSSLFVSKERIEFCYDFLKRENQVPDNGKKELKSFHVIEFHDVYFKYPMTDYYVLKGLSLKIYAGSKVALIGLNGAGKSTFIKLLMRYYDPNSGEITVDGVNLKEYTVSSVYSFFSTMFQDFAWYAMPLRDNISLCDLERRDSDNELWEALEFAGFREEVESWPLGLDTIMGKQFDDNGLELSGGQWQKIALARFYFSSGQFIVMDEPSASIDPKTEYDIFNKIYSRCADKTVLLITHRLSNVNNSDQIFVLENGVVAEQGTHSELMSQDGAYSYLYRLQADKYAYAES